MKKQIIPITVYGDKLFDTEESNIDKQVVIDSILALEEVESNFQLNRVYSYVQDMYDQKKLSLIEYEMLKQHVESLPLKDIKLKWNWNEKVYVVLGFMFFSEFLYYIFNGIYTSSWFISYLFFIIVHRERFNRRLICSYAEKIKEYQHFIKSKRV